MRVLASWMQARIPKCDVLVIHHVTFSKDNHQWNNDNGRGEKEATNSWRRKVLGVKKANFYKEKRKGAKRRGEGRALQGRATEGAIEGGAQGEGNMQTIMTHHIGGAAVGICSDGNHIWRVSNVICTFTGEDGGILSAGLTCAQVFPSQAGPGPCRRSTHTRSTHLLLICRQSLSPVSWSTRPASSVG